MEDGVLRLTFDGESSLLPGILMVMAWVSLYPESLLSLLLHPRLLSSSIGLFSSHAQFVYTGGFLWVESRLSSLPVCHLEGSTQAFHLSVTSWEPQEPALHSQGSRVPPPSPCPPLHPHLRRME